jgi:hypothetical protein
MSYGVPICELPGKKTPRTQRKGRFGLVDRVAVRRRIGDRLRHFALLFGVCSGSLAPTFTRNAQATAPGSADRLAGAQAQGPATVGLAALHHNPAMLTWQSGYTALVGLQGGLESQRSKPPGASADFAHGTLYNGFFGGSATFDNVAIALGAYGLGQRFRHQNLAQRPWQRASDSDFGCRWSSDRTCPRVRSGGETVKQADLTLGIGYRFLDRWALGVGIHVPRVVRRLGRNEILPPDLRPPFGCSDPVEARKNPSCSARLAYDVDSNYRLFGLNREGSARLDFALTLGLAVEFRPGWRVGLRYRSTPILENGHYRLAGQAIYCPAESAATLCRQSASFDAEVQLAAAREAAVGLHAPLNRRQSWTFDAQLAWRDECPGIKKCDRRATDHLTLSGIGDGGAWLSETPIYRGQRDFFTLEAWTTVSRLPVNRSSEGSFDGFSGWSWISGLATTSPSVAPNAIVATGGEGWTVKGTIGTHVEWFRRGTRFSLEPGYGIDWALPVSVGNQSLFDASAIDDFANSGSDIYDPSANAVLSGRARPTNEGRYQTWRHVLLLNFKIEARAR